MQLTQKHIIAISIVAIIAMIGYGSFQKNTPPSQSDGVKLSTGSISPISQSGIETDTGKRLEIAANSGTAWGMSPFGSGKPLTEEEKKPEFKKPNTEWKTRTLSGITYVFGEGNPAGVALTVDDLKKDLSEKCPEDLNDPKRIFCTEESGYMSAEVEKYLLIALSDPNWERLMNLCEESLRRNDPAILESSYQASYNRIVYEDYLDINNNWVTISSITGRKNLNVARTKDLTQWITLATNASWDAYNSPVPNPYKNPTCVDVYGSEIIRNLRIAVAYYLRPIQVF